MDKITAAWIGATLGCLITWWTSDNLPQIFFGMFIGVLNGLSLLYIYNILKQKHPKYKTVHQILNPESIPYPDINTLSKEMMVEAIESVELGISQFQKKWKDIVDKDEVENALIIKNISGIEKYLSDEAIKLTNNQYSGLLLPIKTESGKDYCNHIILPCFMSLCINDELDEEREEYIKRFAKVINLLVKEKLIGFGCLARPSWLALAACTGFDRRELMFFFPYSAFTMEDLNSALGFDAFKREGELNNYKWDAKIVTNCLLGLNLSKIDNLNEKLSIMNGTVDESRLFACGHV